jgi:hypothetical protein
MEDFLWGLFDGIIAWPTLIVNVFGGDYEVFQDRRGDGWYAFGFLLGGASPFLGFFGRRPERKRHSE